MAKPKRQFTAQYRLRILEEAGVLRREGLYSSHLTNGAARGRFNTTVVIFRVHVLFAQTLARAAPPATGNDQQPRPRSPRRSPRFVHRPRCPTASTDRAVPDPGRDQPVRERRNAQSSLLHQARAGGHGPQPDLVRDIKWTSFYLYVLLDIFRRRLDGCRSGERRARRDARGNLSQARHRPRCSPCIRTAARR